MLYLPPGCDAASLSDKDPPLLITEGEFKALAWRLARWNSQDGQRFLPVGIAGVFDWRGTIGKTTGPDGQRVNVTSSGFGVDRLEGSQGRHRIRR